MQGILKKQITLLFIVFSFITVKVNAQTTQDKDTTKSYFKASLSYLSNAVYNGRQDSIAYPYNNQMLG